MKANISIISLGGTIAMTPDKDSKGVVPQLSAADLIAAVPQIEKWANISAQTFRTIPGAHLTFKDLYDLSQEITAQTKKGAEGIVITQGTDTIEETAYTLDLLLNIDTPVIVTGAMRNPSQHSADGKANILSAVQVAIHPKAHSNGVLVVLNDEIHSARFVTKTHTSNLATFKSHPLGAIGWVCEDDVQILLSPYRTHHIDAFAPTTTISVPIIKVALGDDERLINAAISAGVNGLVIEALGGGHVPVAVADALEQAAKKIPIILSSRTGQGKSLTSTYGFVGSEIDLLQRGLISSGLLNGLRARILLCLLLHKPNITIKEISKAFCC